MTIEKKLADGVLNVALDGRLDTLSAPSLEAELGTLAEVKTLIFDMAKLEYTSSAGLRVLLAAQKKMTARQGSMILRNIAPSVMEVFEITGFSDILTIE